MYVLTLGLGKIVPGEIDQIFPLYFPAAKRLAQDECDVIVAAGTPVLTYMGYDKALELGEEIRKSTGVATIIDLQAAFDALKALNAKKIVIATPYEEARNQERKKLAESVGFKVVNIKGLGIQRAGYDIAKQPSYASYRLAKQAFNETPDCDAIWISCPAWQTVANIEKLEHDVGKPVISAVTSVVWASLKQMHMKEPIKGYGRLLEMER